ncbi:ankyrin repeat family A protein 2 [Euwallacea fornicatus]|uniref:ankyrin repeat family A protein 2 n=1 Tax=Euwallacea fornicatus TaxID=995702 RepID=UPI00338E78E3
MDTSPESINDEDSSKTTSPQISNSRWSPVPEQVATPKWSPQSLHDKNRKSAFQPYKLCTPSSTVLTNLQRGNTQAETLIPQTVELTFHMKAGQGELNSPDILQEKSVDVLDSNNLTALHWSAAYGQYNAVELLISFNADVNKLGPDEESPLILAASGGHHEVVRLLLNHGAEVDHVNHLCNTALMYAAKENHPHTCQELLLNGANFGLVNLDDDTALSIAIENNSTSAQTVIENFIISRMEEQPKKED